MQVLGPFLIRVEVESMLRAQVFPYLRAAGFADFRFDDNRHNRSGLSNRTSDFECNGKASALATRTQW